MAAPLNYDGKGSIRIGALKLRASRWPWQAGYNWHGMISNSAPLNAGGARFGGGWKFKLGVAVGGSTVICDLIFGMLVISIETQADRDATAKFREWQEHQRAERQQAAGVPF